MRRAACRFATRDVDFAADIDALSLRCTGPMAYLAQWLTEQDVLRPNVTIDEAADLLWLLASIDLPGCLVTTAERSLCR